jgi:hypothetical protein
MVIDDAEKRKKLIRNLAHRLERAIPPHLGHAGYLGRLQNDGF